MDLDVSLTPPNSPSTGGNELQLQPSPVLISKNHKRSGSTRSRDSNNEHPCLDYTVTIRCQPPIHGRLYYDNAHIQTSLIPDAQSYWSNIPMLDVVGELHDCSRCKRKVMDQKMCLNDLANLDTACNFFYQVTMYFHDIEDLVKKWTTCSSIQNLADINLARKYRRYIDEAMLFLCEFVQNCGDGSETTDILANIFDSMMMLSNLSHSSILEGVKLIVQRDIENLEPGRKRTSPVEEWFHCYIHIHVAMLKLLPILCKQDLIMRHIESTQVIFDNGLEISDSGFYHKITKKIFSLTLNVALEKYCQLQRNCKSDKGTFMHSLFFQLSPFPCLCSQELVSLCLHTTAAQLELCKRLGQNDSDALVSQSSDLSKEKLVENCSPLLWKMTSVFISNVMQDVSKTKSLDGPPKGPPIPHLDSIKDALSFCWWWTWEVAHLFFFNECGQFKIRPATVSYMPLLSKLLRMTLSSCDEDMALMSSHLICYKAIVSFWRNNSGHPDNPLPTEVSHLHLVWAQFSKKLNMVKKSESFGIHKYTLKDDKGISPEKWTKKCAMYLNKEEILDDMYQLVTSRPLDAFLSIFGEILSLGCWKEVKNRFLSRIRMNEVRVLNEDGLTILFQLFILITSSDIGNEERIDVFGKLSEYLEGISLPKTEYRKMKVFLNGLFSCMHISIQHSVEVQAIAIKCGATASQILKIFSETSRNLEQRNSLWKIIDFYFRNLAHIFQLSKSFHLYQELLVPSVNVRSSLSVMKCTEAVVILENLSAIFSTLRSHLRRSKSRESLNKCTAVTATFFDYFLPWLKILSKTEDNAAEEIANLLIEMSGIIVKIIETKPPLSFPVKLSDLLSHFCGSVDVKIQIRYRFTWHILSEENCNLVDVINGNNVESGSCRAAVIQGGLKCIVCHPSKECQDRLTRSISTVHEIQDVVRYDKPFAERSFEDFLKTLKQRFDSSEFEDRRKLREQILTWFNPIADVISGLVKSHSYEDPKVMMTIYKTCGSIVKQCGRILYSPGNRGLVTRVFDILVLPRSAYVPIDKDMNPALLSVLNHTLHIFVESLLNLDYGRDPYVQRVLRDVVKNYLTRFPAAMNAASHPFCRTFSRCDLNTVQKCAFLKVLNQHCDRGPDIERQIHVLIDIVHAWIVNARISSFSPEEIPAVRPILHKAKLYLNSLPAVRTKLEIISSHCEV